MCCDCLRNPQPHVNKRKVMPAKIMHRLRDKHWKSQRENRFYFEGNGMRPGHGDRAPP
eukprot:gene30893-26551_t